MKFTDDNFVTKKGHIRYLEELKVLAIKNRKNPTEAEHIMWRYLRKSKYKFIRQKPVFRFILDFYCRELLLCIEIDGDSHNKKKKYDLLRDQYLKTINIKTIRFTNEEVLNNFDKVLQRLLPLLRGDTGLSGVRIKQKDKTSPLVKGRYRFIRSEDLNYNLTAVLFPSVPPAVLVPPLVPP